MRARERRCFRQRGAAGVVVARSRQECGGGGSKQHERKQQSGLRPAGRTTGPRSIYGDHEMSTRYTASERQVREPHHQSEGRCTSPLGW